MTVSADGTVTVPPEQPAEHHAARANQRHDPAMPCPEISGRVTSTSQYPIGGRRISSAACNAACSRPGECETACEKQEQARSADQAKWIADGENDAHRLDGRCAVIHRVARLIAQRFLRRRQSGCRRKAGGEQARCGFPRQLRPHYDSGRHHRTQNQHRRGKIERSPSAASDDTNPGPTWSPIV